MLNLVIVAHPDDEILGFGASGIKAVKQGETVQAVILGSAADARGGAPSKRDLQEHTFKANSLAGFAPPVLGEFPNIRMNTIAHLELVQFIERQIAHFRPNRVFTHHPNDLNDDHRCVALACLAAARLGQRDSSVKLVDSIHLMEILSATDWAFPGVGMPFEPNLYVEVEGTLEQKIEALSCYEGVMREFPHPRSRDVIQGLAAYRGGQSGMRYAEAFQTVFRREM